MNKLKKFVKEVESFLTENYITHRHKTGIEQVELNDEFIIETKNHGYVFIKPTLSTHTKRYTYGAYTQKHKYTNKDGTGNFVFDRSSELHKGFEKNNVFSLNSTKDVIIFIENNYKTTL